MKVEYLKDKVTIAQEESIPNMERYCVWWPSLTSKHVTRVCQHQLSFLSSLAIAVTIASTHCAYPYRRTDRPDELAWVAGYVVRQFTCLKAVTIPLLTGLNVEQLCWWRPTRYRCNRHHHQCYHYHHQRQSQQRRRW